MINIYVGNLSYALTSDELREAFEAYGEVSSSNVVSDRETGRSRGFGFVEMTNQAEGEAAIKALDGQPIKGRPVKGNEARPRPPRDGGGARGPRRY